MASVIFDLDGTLVDSLDDLAAALNHVLAARSMPTHDRAAIESFVGDGARMLVRRAIPDGADEDALLAAFRARYLEHLTVHTRAFDGVIELLDALRDRGVPLAVLSNKPHDMTELVVADVLGRARFVEVFGQRDGVPRKPDPAAALELAARLPGPTLFVGDTPVDVQTARAAGMRPIGVGWGMRDEALLREAGAEVILERPGDLLGLLGEGA